MECSLVLIDGETPRKVKSEDYSDLAEVAGLKFIKVRHITGFGNTSHSIRGFQGATVKIDNNNLEKGYELILSKDRNKNDTSCVRPLEFNPDPMTGALLALIPDTEYNRHKLAAAYDFNPFCVILDKEIDKEIKKWSDEIKKTLPKGKNIEEVAVEAVAENERLKAELKRERALREAAEESKGVVENARKRIDAERKKGKKPAVDEGKIVAEVYKENRELIDELKLKYKVEYKNADEYRDKISPEIARRIKEAKYVNSGTGVSNKDKD